VALSRVREGTNLRFMPLHPNVHNLSHLLGLNPPPELLAWLGGFHPSTGVWKSSSSMRLLPTSSAVPRVTRPGGRNASHVEQSTPSYNQTDHTQVRRLIQ